jgi:hypothetical protein
MVCRRIRQLSKSELIDSAQTLEKGRIYKLKLPWVEHDRAPNTVVNDLCARDGTGLKIYHIFRDEDIGAALKIKIKLARRRFRRGTGEGRVFHSKTSGKSA